MINTSNEYKSIIRGHRKFIPKATLELSDGTVLDLIANDIMMPGIEIEDGVSISNAFTIGAAKSNICTIKLNNYSGKFDNYDFTDAIITPYIGLQLSSTIEYLKKGIFVVDEPVKSGSTIILSGFDNMSRLDKPFSDISIAFPCTAIQLLLAVTAYCSVLLATSTFLNSDFIINLKPNAEATTCRDIVSWISQLSGNFARCNVNGSLELKWYDTAALKKLANIYGGTFTKPSVNIISGGTFANMATDVISAGTFADMKNYHHIYAFGSLPTIGTDDVAITGIQVKAKATTSDDGETVLFGSSGYVIEISNNPLIQEGKADIIASTVGAKIVGMTFRTCSANAISDPSREAGDVAMLSNKGNTYPILLSNYKHQSGSNDVITSDAETPSKNGSTSYSPTTKAIVEAKRIIKQEVSTYDLQAQQLTSLITNGFGLFTTKFVDVNGGIIYYMHDKPTMAESSWRWFATSTGMVEQKMVSGSWATVAAKDTEGNALYNVLTARGIVAEWIKAGTIEAEIIAKNIIMQGGKIDIETNSSPGSVSVIRLAGEYINGTATDTTLSTQYSGQYYAYEHHLDGAYETEGMSALLGGKMVCADIAEGRYLYVDGTELNFNNTNNPNTYRCQIRASVQTAAIYHTASGGHRFLNTVYTPDGTVSVSDKNLKNSIEGLDLHASADFIYSLMPSRFKYNNGTSDRFHHGFIAQDVKASMSADDWGVYIESKAEDDENETLIKGLRYEELIADLVATVQLQKVQIEDLQKKMLMLTEKV